MLFDQHFIVQLFLKPEMLVALTEPERSKVMVVLRKQKVLAKLAFLIFDNTLDEQTHEKPPVLNEHALLWDKQPLLANEKPLQLDEKTIRHLKNALRVAEKQKEQVFVEAIEISHILKPVSEFVVFLKGAAYSLNHSLAGQGRIYGDIDILVNKAQLIDCEQTLAMHGWFGEKISDYDQRYYRKWAHEIPPLVHTHRGTIIDVHHNIIPIVSNDAPSASVLKNHIVSNKDGIQTLSLPAQFVHSAVHLFRNEEYKTAFRDVLDLYFMLTEIGANNLSDIIDVAEELDFEYEVGLALRALQNIFELPLSAPTIDLLLNKSTLRVAFDQFIFAKVLLPQHRLLHCDATPIRYFLATVRAHFIKMPLHLLTYHLLMKSGRGIIEKIFGAHIFTPKDVQSNDNLSPRK
jgi:hypothetical protein